MGVVAQGYHGASVIIAAVARAWSISLIALVVAGCGRVGFDPRDGSVTDGSSVDAPSDAPGDTSLDASLDAPTDTLLPDGGLTPIVPSRLDWVLTFPGPTADLADGLGVDGDGNVYIAGRSPGGIDLGRGPIPSDGGNDGFVASFDPSGTLRWLQTLHSPLDDDLFGLAVDRDGYSYAVGAFDTMMQIDATTLTTASSRDAFIVAFDPAGEVRWTKSVGDVSAGELFFGAEVDAANNLYVSGWINGVVDFDGVVLSSTGGMEQDAIIASYTRDGTLRFATNVGGNSLDQGQDIGVSAAGLPALAGLYNTETQLTSGVEPSRGGRDGFIVGFDVGGEPRWSRTFGSTGGDEGNEIAVTTSGTIVLGGRFDSTIDVGGASLDAGAATSGFVAAYTPGGDHLWSYAIGNPSLGDRIETVASGPGGAIHVGGFVGGAATVAGASIGRDGSSDAYWLMFDEAGTLLASRSYGGPLTDSVSAVAQGADGVVFLAGRFRDTVDFEGMSRTSAGSSDVYLLRLAP
jgi:hypothetical protein